MQHRVIVTGIGIVAPNGVGRESFWAAIKDGSSGIKTIKAFDASRYKCRVAGEVYDSAIDSPSGIDKASSMMVAAAEEAMSDAGLASAELQNKKRIGVVVGTIHSGLLTFEKLHRLIVADNNADPDLSQLCECALFSPSLHVARRYDLKGPRSTLTMACASGTAAIGYAASLIGHGRADVVLAGGVDTVSEFIFSGFYGLKALSLTKCRPFDRGRDGMVIGEGAAVLILESLKHAIARKAKVYSEVIGYGLAGDAVHIIAPDREGGGLARAISGAMQEANLSGEALDYINLHGVGTPQTDAMECRALNRCLGEAARETPVSSTKPFTGHAMGAAGAIESAVCLLAIRDGFLPGTLNCEQPDPTINLPIIAAPGRQAKVEVAMSTSSGFGGQHAAVIFGRPRNMGEEKIGGSIPTQRAAITGLGLVAPSTIGAEEYFNRLSGKGNPDPIALDEIVRARLTEDSSPDEVKTIRRMDNISRYALLAARLAVRDAGLDLTKVDSERVGVVLGTTFGSLESDLQYHRKLILEKDLSLAGPIAFQNTSSNIPAAQISILLGIKGANATIASGSAAGANAIAYSYDLLREGRAEIILSGSAEGSIASLAGFASMAGYFHGISFPEGAAILVMETAEAALRRRGKVYCQITGYGMAHSNTDIGEAIETAVELALEDARLGPEQVDYICPNGGPGMAGEMAAVKKLLSRTIRIELPDRMSCEAGAVEGGFNLVNCIRAIQCGARRAVSIIAGPDGSCVSIVLERA